ncbi:MAG TPA: type II secretion system ATPase GspE [Syntrophales bacterium]|nr:type II secretion system ATPase GspE [Syntrophales bacterium]HQN76883.1 type II secretion system ATPase GspE [Syntrophales bacterium]
MSEGSLHWKIPLPSVDPLEGTRDTSEEKGEGLVETLVRNKEIPEEELLSRMAEGMGIPFWRELPANEKWEGLQREVPVFHLRKNRIVPLSAGEERFIVTADPTRFEAVDDLKRALGWTGPVSVVAAPHGVILAAINRLYDIAGDSAEEFIQDMNGESPDLILSEIEERADLLDDTSDAPVIRLVNLMLSRAVKDKASDVHMEPYHGSVAVRYRMDGILYNMFTLPKRVQSPLVSRIKIMSRLNIAEKRLPQDGRIEIRIGDHLVDIRVSIVPTAFGERVVLRLLDKSASMFRLTDLGLDAGRLSVMDGLIRSPYGIILVTGPTGSGKTTTLYAALSTINRPDINIITIEDPVEYQIEGIGQIQVNPRIDLTFARGLRSIVRQDPDVILVGEIRDRETAEIAIQSSLTGHLVFSTLHTNDAASAVTRLTDMGIESFLVSSSVIAIIAQRLVRVLCERCREPYRAARGDLAGLGDEGATLLERKEIYRRKGCAHCLNTGYRGRKAIFEIMVLDDPLKKIVGQTSDANAIRETAVKNGMTTLMEDGIGKILDGRTTVEEVLRITRA